MGMYNGTTANRCLPGPVSQKILQVKAARIHGRKENVDRLRNSPIMGEYVHHPEWMPLLLDEEGNELPFPQPDRDLPAMKPRGPHSRKQDKNSNSDLAIAATQPHAPQEDIPKQENSRVNAKSGWG